MPIGSIISAVVSVPIPRRVGFSTILKFGTTKICLAFFRRPRMIYHFFILSLVTFESVYSIVDTVLNKEVIEIENKKDKNH